MANWLKAKKRSTERARSRKADGVLLALILALVIFGIVMITSIGVPKSIQLSAPKILYPNCDDQQVDCYLIMKNHLIRLGIGLILMLVVAKIPYQFWRRTASFLFFSTVAVLFVVLILGSKANTFATSWLVLFNTSIQPTEFAKLGLVFYLANWLDKRKNVIGDFQNGFLPFCVISGILILPVLLQPDLGGALVIASIAVAMYFAGGARVRHLLLGGFLVILFGTIMVTSISHVRDRFTAFVQSETACKGRLLLAVGAGEIAIGSGGLWGKGLTQGVQKSYWLPQATDDFIFAASAEELGFFRIGILVLLYVGIGYRGYRIASGAENQFAALTAIGLTAWLTFQAFVNIAVNVALMPVTGITLPFVSYGGSSLLSVLIAAGILLQISKYSDYATSNNWRGTGGHIVPNIAIIEALNGLEVKAHKAHGEKLDILYVGEKGGMEEKLVAPLTIQFKAIKCGKMRRYFSWKNFVDMGKVPVGFVQSLRIIRRFKPKVIFCKGGYVCFPVALAGWVLRVPIILHESDVVPGLTTRLLARFASKICLAYEESKKYLRWTAARKVVVTGSPVRAEILTGVKENGYKITGFKWTLPVILVMGGSLGAEAINKLIWSELEELLKKYQVIHITGAGKLKSATELGFEKGNLRTLAGRYFSLSYAGDELADLYAITDLIVSRAGANSLAEIAALGKPAVLIPLSKRASRGDQIVNAEVFEKSHKAVVIDEDKVDGKKFLRVLHEHFEEKENGKKEDAGVAQNDAAGKIAKLLWEF